MTASSALLGLLIATVSGCGEPPRPKQGSSLGKESILAAAHVNGKVQDVNGNRFHLMAIKTSGVFLDTDGSFTAWMLNGRPLRDVMPPADLATGFQTDKLPFDIFLTWMKIPAEGEVEMIYGLVHTGGKRMEHAEQYRQLRKSYPPYSVRVDKLPKVEAASAAELVKKMNDFSKSNAKLGE